MALRELDEAIIHDSCMESMPSAAAASIYARWHLISGVMSSLQLIDGEDMP